ncbi:efflux RND transporter permease subunit [Seleniivibrio sp.]|uniref:efflux RND transporter permease subunit n=1 Tax=Seleniivibrio sp. TaxID=2898801 RepID=UPI0025D280C3|nr:efflux RND transporter permease subunit [Seleniivibrio sp.]
MNFASWSLRNPIPSILFFALLTIAGFYGFKSLHIQDLPDIDLPAVNVELTLPGASPVQLETEVARKAEDSLATIAGIKHINTTVIDGLVSMNVQFVLEKNLSDALLETKDAIDRIRSDLPPNLEEPVISADRIGSNAIMVYAVSSAGMDEEELSWFTDDVIGKRILAVDGVGKFERIGGTDREIKIEIDPVKLASLNVTAADVSQTLKNVQTEDSGGRSRLDGQEQLIRTITTASTASELSQLSVPSQDGRTVRLEQVAKVLDTHAQRSQLSLLDGKEVVGFNIYRAKGADEVTIAENVHKVLTKLEKEHPEIFLTQVNNTVNYTITQYEGSMSMLYEGALLAVIVVWFFLRDWRATLISATALPLSIIPTYAVMHWLGYSLNTLTLLAQAVVVGILVDDAIVEIENIVRHKRMGKPVFTAVSDAVNEIALAVIATTFTIVVVFLPTSLMAGVGGLFFKQFGWTVVISVLFSLLVARLLTPVMAFRFLKDDAHTHKPDGFVMKTYITVVRWCLGHGKTHLRLPPFTWC